MRVCTPAQMRELDRATIEDRGVPGVQLMERAGSGAAAAIRKRFGDPSGRTVFVVCGKGNNGGDGFVVARYLREWGAHVRVFLFASPEELTGDAETNHRRLLEMGQEVVSVDNASSLAEIEKAFGDADLVVDAIFGTGFGGVPRSPLREVIEMINRAACPVASLDIPSGVNGETGAAEGAAVDADLTATFGLPKLGLVLYPGRSLAGEVAVVDIGIPADVVEQAAVTTRVTLAAAAKEMLPLRRPDAHKGDCGRVFVIGGSVGFTGAVALASNAALRAGAGLVTAGVPASLNDILEVKLTEVMTLPLRENSERALATEAAEAALGMASASDAAVLGPGLSRRPEAAACARRLGIELSVPTVIDADGLNAFEGRARELRGCAAARVLTPHPGEASRLLGCATREIAADRLGAARRLSELTRCIVVLKGASTLVSDVDGTIHINPTGNAGLASGGTGDVLSGLIGGLLGQKCPPIEAAILGTFLHGLAADVGASAMGVWGLIAGDLIDLLPNAMKMLLDGDADALWIH